MSYKLLAVDLDGTFLSRDGQPHEADRRALVALRESGVIVTILTGRLYAGTRAAAESIGLVGPVGCADGSHVVEHGSEKTLLHHSLEAARTQMLRDAFRGRDASVFAFGDRIIVSDARGEPYLPYLRTWSNDIHMASEVLEHELFHAGGATAVFALGEEAEVLAARDHAFAACDAASLPRMQVATFPLRNFGSMHGLLARSECATKGTALRWLAAHHGLSIEETVCVGDWWNDVPMLEVAGRSFAMGSAPDEVKAKATHVLEESSEHGGGIARIAKDVFGVEQ